MTKTVGGTILPRTIVVVLAFAASAAPARAVNDEIDFVGRASLGHLTAISEGGLAAERAVDPRVRSLAQRLVDEDRRVEGELEMAAAGSGAAVISSRDPRIEGRMSALRDRVGTDFDRAYVSDQVEAHCNALSLYADYMLLGGNAKLVALAKRTIPIVQKQCVDAKELEGG